MEADASIDLYPNWDSGSVIIPEGTIFCLLDVTRSKYNKRPIFEIKFIYNDKILYYAYWDDVPITFIEVIEEVIV